jgi:hypothetical protein
MQVEWKGQYLYLYSGRNIQCKDEDEIGQKDPFSKVQCIRIDSITGVEIDHTNFTVNLFVTGHPYPIHCSFGDRQCHKMNCHAIFIEKIMNALDLDREMVWDLNRRNKETALSSQRKDEMEVE